MTHHRIGNVAQGGIPASYQPAELRCVLPIDPSNPRLALGFDLPDGSVQRLHISEACARSLILALRHYWPALIGVQSPMSSDSPTVDVSTPLDSEKV